jgi:hypothetical protein
MAAHANAVRAIYQEAEAKLEEWGNFFRPNMEKILGMSADKM